MSGQRARDEISLTVNGVQWRGWLQAEVSTSIESIAGTFSVSAAHERGDSVNIRRQDRVEVRIGETIVIDGYVIAAEPYYRKGEVGLRVAGRDRCGDLVQCSAAHAGGQWRSAGVDAICRDLAAPYGVPVAVANGVDLGQPLTDFTLEPGETVVDAMARAARLAGVLVTRGPAGSLLVTQAGQRRSPGEIRLGVNVVSMESVGSDEARHSVYQAFGQMPVGHVGGDFGGAHASSAQAFDAGMRRHLPLHLHAHGPSSQADLQRLANHTARVRHGHAMGVRYVVDGWTWQGRPWVTNERVTIDDDVAGITPADGDWLICAVRHTLSTTDGDLTELLVRPVDAYRADAAVPGKKRQRKGEVKP